MTDHKARGGVSEAELKAAIKALTPKFQFLHGDMPVAMATEYATAALEAAAQVRAAQDYGGEAEVNRLRASRDEWANLSRKHERQRDAASARAAKAVEVLRKCEPDLRYCSVCDVGLYQGEPHTDDCSLATLLSDHPAPEPGVEAGEVRNG